jgi:hypothetical protein
MRILTVRLGLEKLLLEALQSEEVDPLVEGQFTVGERKMYEEHRKQRMPFHFIPSVREFEITLNEND